MSLEPFKDIPNDSRPMFNGEYRAFLAIDRLFGYIDNFISVGARGDRFYLDTIPKSRCVFVEPDLTAAQELNSYASGFNITNKYIETHGLHPTLPTASITEFGSIYIRKSLYLIKEAIASGVICCPYVMNEVENGSWKEGAYKFEAPCITPAELLKKFSIDPYYIKIDVEGAEVMIIDSFLKAGASPSFIQYEYGVPWFHGNIKMQDMFDCTPGYYHYVIKEDRMILVERPVRQYFYANMVASRRYLGEEIIY